MHVALHEYAQLCSYILVVTRLFSDSIPPTLSQSTLAIQKTTVFTSCPHSQASLYLSRHVI